MSQLIIHLVAGGPTNLLPHLQAYDGEDVCWVGVDRGVLALLDAGIMPKRAFGDFDSIDEQELQQLKNKLPHIDIWPAKKINRHRHCARLGAGTKGDENSLVWGDRRTT